MSALVSTEEAAALLGKPGVRVLDASWHMPAAGRNAREEYRAAHLPGAVFFDIDRIADHSSDLPHMLPPAEDFSREAGALGIGYGDELIIYDSAGLFSAARVWWMFRVFGHARVRVLSGGLPKWRAEGRSLQSGEVEAIPQEYRAVYHPELVRSLAEVKEALATGGQLVDARAAARFRGEAPEPRAGLASGHIPGSCNLPFGECLGAPYGELKKPEELAALFRAVGIDPAVPVIASCGSGVTACVLTLALYECGNERTAVYDGSWAEWGASGQAIASG